MSPLATGSDADSSGVSAMFPPNEITPLLAGSPPTYTIMAEGNNQSSERGASTRGIDVSPTHQRSSNRSDLLLAGTIVNPLGEVIAKADLSPSYEDVRDPGFTPGERRGGNTRVSLQPSTIPSRSSVPTTTTAATPTFSRPGQQDPEHHGQNFHVRGLRYPPSRWVAYCVRTIYLLFLSLTYIRAAVDRRAFTMLEEMLRFSAFLGALLSVIIFLAGVYETCHGHEFAGLGCSAFFLRERTGSVAKDSQTIGLASTVMAVAFVVAAIKAKKRPAIIGLCIVEVLNFAGVTVLWFLPSTGLVLICGVIQLFNVASTVYVATSQ
ncbi:hypothetical protein GALMADRAFT_282197, partial [Galerina marginata CBS 339.88]